jgi:hypothetical protein
METVSFSEMLASTDESIWHQNPEHHHHCRENLKYHMVTSYLAIYCSYLPVKCKWLNHHYFCNWQCWLFSSNNDQIIVIYILLISIPVLAWWHQEWQAWEWYNRNKNPVTALEIQCVLKVALPEYLVVIIRRCQTCTEHAWQQFEQFL